jgi:pyruvate-formate lyase-activating enzyme/thioesterase domain-containing protein
VIAYEMAQQLIKEGQQMAFLGLFDSYNASKLRPPESSREKLATARQKMHFHWSNLRELGPREQFAYFTEKLKVARARELSRLSVKLGNFSRRLNPARSGKRVEVFLEDFNEKLSCAYRPKVYVGNATIFRPRQNYAFHQDPTLGWGDLVKGGLEVINLPVNPGGLFVEPYVQVLASKLKECLQKAESSPRSNPQQEHTMNNIRVSHPDLAEVARTLRPLRFPTRFAVEICAECNLACAMCHHPAMRRPKGKMPFELWKRCADEIAAESPGTQCWFSFCGEPLLEPNLLLKMIQYGKAVGLKSLNINTNGMLLTEKIGQRILDSGADLVVLGIDGFSRGTYEKIRVRGKRDVVYSNVERFLSQRQTRNTGPEIQVQFIEMEENSHELEAFKRHWLSHGATLKIRNKLSWGGKFNTPLDVPESERIPCPWAITMMHVFWDGRVPRCPGDTEGDESVGNAWDESLIALWDRLGADRAKHLEYRFQDLSERCHHCKDWMTGVAQRISPPSASLQAS